MPKRPRSSSSPHSAWRGHPQTSDSARKAKQVTRVLLSLLGLALAGVLAWLLIPPFLRGDVHLVCLPVITYNVGSVSPIPFALEDTEELEKSSFDSAVMLRDLQTSESITTLNNRLQGAVTRPKDTLILYISAHGVSDDGTAYLLCSDYLRKDYLREAGVGRYKLGDLLHQVSQCPAALKLLILDVGHIPADPRLGMVVNEFPRLLEKELKNINDPDLWVLTANRSLESSRVSYSARRSIFGHFLAEGLKGAADRDGDGMVELAELFDFVGSGVAGCVERQSGGSETQTPWLLRGGGADAGPPADIDLLPVSDLPREDESKTDAAKETDGAEPGSDPQALAAKQRKQVRELLERAWRLRDQMQDRKGADSWSPIDYAPHLWREYQELLIGYESRYLCGKAFKPKDLARELEANVLPLEDLIERGKLPSGVGRRTVLGRLAEARRQFLESDATAGFKQGSEEAETIGEAICLKHDLLFWAAYYVRWHARASRASSARLRLHKPISALLSELAEFVDQLEALEEAGLAGESRVEMREVLPNLSEMKRTLEGLRRSIEQDGLEKDAVELLENPKKTGNTNRIESLLSTPCLSGVRRMELLDALEKMDRPPAEAAAARTGPGPKAPTIAKWQWDRLHDQAELEARLVRLADPAAQLALPTESAGSGDPEAAKRLWKEYREFGKELGDFYRGLPERINKRLASDDPAEVRSSERLLRLVDPRDASSVAEEVNSIAVRAIRLPGPPSSRLIVGGPTETLKLTPDGPTPFEVTVQRAGLSSDDARVMLKYNPDEVTIESGDERLSAAPDKWARISLQQDQTTLSYAATPKVDTDSPTSLELVLEAGGRSATCIVKFQLPAPDVVDLQVHRVVDAIGGMTDRWIQVLDDDHVRLRPFPNRVTTYRFDLVNRSGREKQVEVQLLAVPRLRPGQRLSRELLVDSLGNLRPGIEKLTSAAEKMELPADRDPQPIRFPAPQPPATEAGAAESGEDKEPRRKPLITRGMACVIRDTASGEWKWIKWIELSPLAPVNYLDPHAEFDPVSGKITVDLMLRDRQDLPPLSDENPISVQWTNQEVLGPDPSGKFQARITVAEPVEDALFAAVVSSPGKVVPVHLTVDDYPRAFVFPVPCDQATGPLEPAADLRNVEITWPEGGHCYRVPLAPDLPMLVKFKVDAPADAFQEGRGVVELGIDRNRDRELRPDEVQHSFQSDRQVEVSLHEVRSPGEVRIGTELSDFQIELDPGGLKNMEVDVVARLLLAIRGPQRNREEKRDSVTVVLDGGSPELLRIDVPARKVPKDKPLEVAVEAKDLSGVKEMKIGVDLNENGQFDADEQPKVVNKPGTDGKWHAELPTDKLQPDTRYRILIIAVDKAGNPPTRNKDPIEVTIGQPAEDNGAEKKSTLKGLLLLGSERCPGVKVSLKGDNHSDEATSDQNGRFTFQNVPHGSYTIEAKGRLRRFTVEGSAKVTLPQAKEPASVDVKLDWR